MPHGIFDAQAERYDRWYDDHPETYRRELEIIGSIAAARGASLEIGVGTGRFAAPLGIRLGLDPSLSMLRMARARGVQVIGGIAEALPFRDRSMRSILVMTSLCYFDDPRLALGEMFRILTGNGKVIIGFLGRGDALADYYRGTREKETFLAHATFYTPAEVTRMLDGAGFSGVREESPGRSRAKGFHVMSATRPGPPLFADGPRRAGKGG